MSETNVRAILLDIEGTTTPIEFVYKVLFPYARQHIRQFVRLHSNDLQDDISALKAEHAVDAKSGNNPPAWRESSPDLLVESITQYVYWLMDLDRKSGALKSLQGKIWEAGYCSGRLLGQVYPDVLPAFSRWREQQRSIFIFSSGSILAQKLLFAHTTEGDLTEYISNYFDTTIGAKTMAESYRSISVATGWSAPEVLFISDVTAELDAAKGADMKTALCVRTGSLDLNTSAHWLVPTFDIVFP
jgi:enolase-phosphatase E1